MLRPGNVHCVERWRQVLEPIVKRYKKTEVRLLFRADVAFAKPEVYDYLELRDIGYAHTASHQRGAAGAYQASTEATGWATT